MKSKIVAFLVGMLVALPLGVIAQTSNPTSYFRAGTAAAPGFYVLGDSNTGIWSAGADRFNVSTAGAARMEIAADGSVLIGTTTDDAELLKVAGLAEITGQLTLGDNALLTRSNDGAAGFFATNTSAGTAAYAAVQAANDVSTGYVALDAVGTGFTTAGAYVQDAAVLDAGAGLSGGLSVVAQAGTMRFYTNGATNERLEIQADGTVSIGTSADSAFALDVTGNVNFTGELTVSGYGTGVNTFLDTPSSANLAAAVTGETGTGNLVFHTNPTFSGATLAGTTVNITSTNLQRNGNAAGLSRTFTAAYDPASLAANTSRCDDVPVTGITTSGGAVTANIGAVDPGAGCVVASVRASAADTVRVCWRNAIDAVTACDTASSTWTFSQPQ